MAEENQNLAWVGQVSQNSQTSQGSWSQPGDDFVLDFWDWLWTEPDDNWANNTDENMENDDSMNIDFDDEQASSWSQNDLNFSDELFWSNEQQLDSINQENVWLDEDMLDINTQKNNSDSKNSDSIDENHTDEEFLFDEDQISDEAMNDEEKIYQDEVDKSLDEQIEVSDVSAISPDVDNDDMKVSEDNQLDTGAEVSAFEDADNEKTQDEQNSDNVILKNDHLDEGFPENGNNFPYDDEYLTDDKNISDDTKSDEIEHDTTTDFNVDVYANDENVWLNEDLIQDNYWTSEPDVDSVLGVNDWDNQINFDDSSIYDENNIQETMTSDVDQDHYEDSKDNYIEEKSQDTESFDQEEMSNHSGDEYVNTFSNEAQVTNNDLPLDTWIVDSLDSDEAWVVSDYEDQKLESNALWERGAESQSDLDINNEDSLNFDLPQSMIDNTQTVNETLEVNDINIQGQDIDQEAFTDIETNRPLKKEDNIDSEIVSENSSKGILDQNSESVLNSTLSYDIDEASLNTSSEQATWDDIESSPSANAENVEIKTDSLEWQEVQSTLSLDQILDTELQLNWQNTDMQTSEKSFLSKKIVPIAIGTWVFALAVVVVFMAFPNLLSGWGSNTNVYEEHGTSYDQPTPVEYEMTGQEYSDEQNVVDEPQFPDPTIDENVVGQDNDYEMDNTQLTDNPKPYTGPVVNEIGREENNESTLSQEEILSEISSFKSRGEIYYKDGQEKLDREIVKYARKIIYLCDEYEARIMEWTWIDNESFDNFNSAVLEIINKIDNSYNGWSEGVTIVQNDFNSSESSYFEGREEVEQFVNSK